MTPSFAQLLAESPLYAEAYQHLARSNAILARSARTVVELQGWEEVRLVAESVLSWTERHYGPDFIDRYLERLRILDRLQQIFEESPSATTLGDPQLQVERATYDISLLLSFVYSNHRFELLKALKTFLHVARTKVGRIACVGVGTGYEVFVASTLLTDWLVEGYDCNAEARYNTRHLLDHFLPRQKTLIAELFPLDDLDVDFCSRFDAIVMCELLEHLQDPLRALRNARQYLTPKGKIFVTMAINLAQEDHVFLYRNVASCRAQLVAAGFTITREWVIPVIVHPAQKRQVHDVERGNYVAICARSCGAA